MFAFETVAPSPDLTHVVERYFITRADIPADTPVEKVLLPSIMQSLLLNLNATPQFIAPPIGESKWHDAHLLLGQYTKSFCTVLTGSIRFIGVHFTPTGLYQLTGACAAAFSDRVVPVLNPQWISFFNSMAANTLYCHNYT